MRITAVQVLALRRYAAPVNTEWLGLKCLWTLPCKIRRAVPYRLILSLGCSRSQIWFVQWSVASKGHWKTGWLVSQSWRKVISRGVEEVGSSLEIQYPCLLATHFLFLFFSLFLSISVSLSPIFFLTPVEFLLI